MKDSRKVIEAGIRAFRNKYNLAWNDLIIGTAGDLLTALTDQKVLYAPFRPDFAAFEAESIPEAESIAAEFQSEGAKVVHARRFGERIWMFVFSPKVPVPVGPFPPLPEVPGWNPPFADHRPLGSATTPGEKTPFRFKGEIYRLDNIHIKDASGRKILESCNIRRESDDKLIAEHILPHHYFASAFVWNDRCWCYAQDVTEQHHLDMVYSDDLVHWSKPETVLDLTGIGQRLYNTGVTWDGKRFVMICECADPNYPIFTHKFLESDDLIHWKFIPNAMYGQDKYVGGPAIYWIKEDGYYYVTYVDQFIHPAARRLNYRNSIARSKDLIHWEDAPEDRPVVTPVYTYVAHPVEHPNVYEFNTSDVEFIEDGGKVRIYFLGGDQLGVFDDQIAECPGTLPEVLASFFK